MGPFRDRVDAGRQLAERLRGHFDRDDVVVLGLPRGGVPVAVEVARELDAPLDVIVVRKLGLPHQPELAMGAVAEEGVLVWNDDVIARAGVGGDESAEAERFERSEVDARAERYRGGRRPLPLAGRIAVVVDDGVATGATVQAACLVARARGASRVVLATPVAPRSSIEPLSKIADDVVCLTTPRGFYAVGEFYDDFSPTSSEDVIDLLARYRTSGPVDGAPADDGG